MNNIKRWYLENHTEITWFFNGVLTLDGLINFGRGDYINAAISFGLVALNIALRNK